MRLPILVSPRRLVVGLSTVIDLEPAEDSPCGFSSKGKAARAELRLFGLVDALDTEHDTYAHAVAYRIVRPDGTALEDAPRLSKGSLPAVRAAGYDVVCSSIWIDLDLKDLFPGSGDKLPWTDLTDAQREEVDARIESARTRLVDRGYPWLGFYATKNGLRFVHGLAVDVQAGPGYEGLLARIRAAYHLADLPIDDSCKDWTRLFALPRVVRDDDIETWSQEWLFVEGFDLDDDACYVIPSDEDLEPMPESAIVDVPRVADGTPRPDPDSARGLVEFYDEKAKSWRLSEAAKKAKRHLKEAACFGWLFESAALSERGGRHTALTSALGEIIAGLHGFPWASIEFVYGLVLEPLSRFGEDDDWEGKAWEMIGSFWHGEDVKKAQRKAELALAQPAPRTVGEDSIAGPDAPKSTPLETFLTGVRKWFPTPGLSDETLVEALRSGRYGLLQDSLRDRFHVLLPSGFYDDHACNSSALASVIQQRGMDWLIPIEGTHDDGRGNLTRVPLKASAIAQRSARVYTGEEIRLDHRGSYLDLDTEKRDVFVAVPFRLRDDIEPRFDEDIYEAWVRMVGDRADEALRAIGMLLLFQHGPTAAVLLWGEKNSGKSLLAESLAECISTRMLVDARALVDNFNSEMTQSPIIHFEETADRGTKGIDAAGALRKVITASRTRVEPKGRDAVRMQGVHRVLMTANSTDILTRLVGDQARGSADWAAVAERVIEFEVDPTASEWFTARNKDWRMTRDWIGDRRRIGKYAQFWFWVIRELIEWEGERPKKLGSRLLMEGNAAGRLIQTVSMDAGAVPEVACAINRLLANRTKPAAVIEDGKVWVLRGAVIDEAASAGADRHEARHSLDSLFGRDQDGDRRTFAGTRARWRWIEAKRLLFIIEQHEAPNRQFEVPAEVKVAKDLKGIK